MDKILTYTGKALADGFNGHDLRLAPYIPSPDLVKAVNIALFLGKRPLLLMGEPGVGKTRLAESIAFEILGEHGFKENYFRWNIKSTSKAKDGLYRYDVFNRFADAQILKSDDERKRLNNLKLGEEGSYIQKGDLAMAITKSTIYKRAVILIDEIDKADIDFPNDLLNELENYEFVVTETGERIEKPPGFAYPIIIITSNQERELPSAFLRRCLYHYINFPSDGELGEIINKVFHTPKEDTLVKKALTAFRNARDLITETEKKPSTSELLDWFQVMDHYSRLKQDNYGSISANEREMIKALDLLDTGKIPFAEVLFKTYETFTPNFYEQ